MSIKWRINKNSLPICLLLVLFCLRIAYLDLDSPTYSMLHYTRADEGHYAMQAIKNIMFEELQSAQTLDGGQYRTWDSSACFLCTLFCSITLKLFGKNFYGLRLAAFFAGAISYYLTLKLISNEEKKKNPKAHWVLLIVGICILFNFPYLISCRFIDPGIFRIMLLCITMYLVWKDCNSINEPRYFLLGIASTLSIVWGYLTNIFVFVPVAMLLLHDLINKQKIGKKLKNLVLGIVISYFIGEICIYVTQKTTFIATSLRICQAMGDSRLSFSLYDIIYNLNNLCMGNIFSYNAIFAILSIISVIYVLFSGYKKNDKFRIWLAWLIIGFFVQSIFTNDTLIRKSIVIYLFLMVAFAYTAIDFVDIREYFTRLSNLKKSVIYIVLVLAGMGWFILSNRRLGLIEEIDFSSSQKAIFIGLNIMIVCLLFLGLILIKRIPRKGLGILVMLMILPEIFLGCKYFSEAEYGDKEIMIELNEYVGENYVLGGYPFAYCLYNNIIPLSSNYDKFFPEEREERAKLLLQNDLVKYYLGNYNKEMIDGWLEGTPYEWALVKIFDEKARDYGGRNTIYLYEKVLIE